MLTEEFIKPRSLAPAFYSRRDVSQYQCIKVTIQSISHPVFAF